MSNSAGVNIKVGEPVECYYPALKRGDSQPYEYHESFLLNNEFYNVQDFAVINSSFDIEVVKLLCIYTTRERKVQVCVQKYIFARNLKEELAEKGCTKFDDSEVVEDLRRDYTINPHAILRKCILIYGQEDENYIISESNYNPLRYFSCRYTLTTRGLYPILSIPQSILNECNVYSGIKQPIEYKKRSGVKKILSITHVDSSSDENTPRKMKISKDSHKSVKMSVPAISDSPAQRNLVKRNLNKSFGDSPGKNGDSILNYSIISDEEYDNSLILKLRISEKNIPLVVLKKDNDDSYSTKLKVKEKEPEQSVRKSTRIRERKSYADYISPVKSTPRKRNISDNVSESSHGVDEATPVKNSRTKSQSRLTETPAKSLSVSEKRPINTPKRYQDHEFTSPRIGSARRSLRLTSVEEDKKKVPLPRSTRSSKRRKSPNSEMSDEEKSLPTTPEKRVNLNESMRRTIFKVRAEKAEVEKENITVNSKGKRGTFDSSSDDESTEGSTPRKSPRRSISVRSARKRSTSTSDNQRDVVPDTPKTRRAKEYSDDDYSPSKDSAPKTPKTLNRKRDTSQIQSGSKLRPKSTTKPKPVPTTPKTRRIPQSDSDDDYSSSDEEVPKTPSTRRRGAASPKKTPRRGNSLATPKQTPKTPRNRAKLIREGVITPSMHSRTKAVAGDSTPLMKARSQLHVSYVPSSLPCREREYRDVFNFLEGKLLDGCGGCMYVSGVPGTGKTATVTAVVNHLLQSNDVPKFSYVSVNGMKLTEPRQAYVEILKQLADKTVPWEQAQSILEERFTKSKKQAPVVMVIDELDVLCTKRQDVVYNLLDWPSKAKSQLIVVTIANTMDLPERLLMSRVASRLGLTRLTFEAYTHKQLQEIVTKRLTGTDSFKPDAIQFVARKVASVSGDARRALDICRRAAEIAETEGKGQLVNMTHVNEALNAMITQPKVRAIKNCSRLERLLLQSIVAEVERTGVEETTVGDVYKMLISCAAIDGFRMVSSTLMLSAVCRLSACRLLLTDQKCNDINQRIVLNVSVDDVYYALKKD